jgi:hypothetical protein
MQKIILLALALMSGAAHAQLIDAEKFIKHNGYTKKAVAGKTTYFTALKKVSAEEMMPYVEAVKTMSQTEDARTVCKGVNSGAVKQLTSESRNDLRVRDAFGYGGPVDNTIACIVFYEQQGDVRGVQVHYLTLSLRSPTQEIYTVILTH